MCVPSSLRCARKSRSASGSSSSLKSKSSGPRANGSSHDPLARHKFANTMTDYFAHESSYVDDGAVIGKGTKIWHFSHVMPGAVIGERCNLGQNVVVMPGVRIGSNVKIQNNVSIYEGVEL